MISVFHLTKLIASHGVISKLMDQLDILPVEKLVVLLQKALEPDRSAYVEELPYSEHPQEDQHTLTYRQGRI